MINDAHQKVQPAHLKRNAYLYVRQSTLRQVFENTESTKRQYGLRQRAVALGWAEARIVVIDSDLGQSGASSDREGFQRLVAEVGMGHAGIVLGLEVSRLARNSMDCNSPSDPRLDERYSDVLRRSLTSSTLKAAGSNEPPIHSFRSRCSGCLGSAKATRNAS
jgi:hypothetical protein